MEWIWYYRAIIITIKGHILSDTISLIHIVPIILDKNASIYNNELNGPIFVTVGTAGEILHNFINQKPFVKTQFLHHGFLNLEVTNNGSNMTGTFYENNGLISEDQFTILKKHKTP